jgi:hypothetical protein
MSQSDSGGLQSAATDRSIDPVDALDFEPETGKRAIYEAFDYERAGNIVRVWNESHGQDVDAEHVYTVELDARDVPERCACPDYEYRRGPDGEACKHMAAVALHLEQIDDVAIATDGGEIIEAGDEGEILEAREPSVEYSRHVEPPEQGGEPYVRCESCGAELLESAGGKDNLVHREGCPAGEGR